MRHSNTCPICNSHNIFLDDSSSYSRLEVTRVYASAIDKYVYRSAKDKDPYRSAIDRYVCLDCGYVEEYTYPTNKRRTLWQKIRDFFDYEK